MALDPRQRHRFAIGCMTPAAGPEGTPPPLGSWTKTYAAAAALAVLVMVMLWWLTAALNQPLGNAR